jgi:hypothetical protein
MRDRPPPDLPLVGGTKHTSELLNSFKEAPKKETNK